MIVAKKKKTSGLFLIYINNNKNSIIMH